MVVGTKYNSGGHEVEGAIVTTDGGTDWSDASSGLPTGNPNGFSTSLYGVSCPSTATCVAVGRYPSSPNGPTPLSTIEVTTDGGSSWSAQSSPPSDTYPLSSVSCAIDSSCIAAGGNGLLSTHDGSD